MRALIYATLIAVKIEIIRLNIAVTKSEQIIIVTDIEEIKELVGAQKGTVSGLLSCAATVAFAKQHILPLLPEFADRYPQLKIKLEVTDRFVDLVDEGIDVAIRFTEQLSDPTLITRRLAANKRIICAALAYIKAHGVPEVPTDLEQHNCLQLYTVSSFNDWEFEGVAGISTQLISGNFETNSADALYHAALSGLEIARLSTYIVGRDILAGRLIRVLPDYIDEKASILAVYPHPRHLSPKVRAFIDFLVEKYLPIPPWEIEI